MGGYIGGRERKRKRKGYEKEEGKKGEGGKEDRNG